MRSTGKEVLLNCSIAKPTSSSLLPFEVLQIRTLKIHLRMRKQEEKQIHQKVEITKIDILDTRKIEDGAGKSYEAVTVHAEGNLIRTGTVNKLEFREPVKFAVEFLFIRNPDLLGNGRLPLVVQDFKYKESPL
jgi:hypothetical protein